MRADSASRDTPLNDIIKRLGELDRPRFRFSCREADWLQAVDQSALCAAAPSGSLELLHLDPLNDEEVIELLRRRVDRVPDALAFMDKAQKQSLDALLRNPLLLNLLVDAVGDDWPKGRAQVYERACERMAAEHDHAIAAALGASQPSVESVLDTAGFICAVLLLSGTDAVVTGPTAVDPRSEVSAQSLRTVLDARQIEAALSSKLFVADDARRLFRHRSIVEYLAARALGRRITNHGLPMSRVAALMCAHDGGVVEPLRGLNAWLSVTCAQHRRTLIDRDSLGCVLYGDVHGLDVSAKRSVLKGLRREAERFVWFRNGHWASHPFGALGTTDMASEFAQHLASTDRSPAHQSLLECVLEAIEHGEPQPALLPRLEAVFRDSSYRDDVRVNALDAWLAQPVRDPARALAWLDEIRDGTIDDARDGLCGRLLTSLYPHTLDPTEVMQHFHTGQGRQLLRHVPEFLGGAIVRMHTEGRVSGRSPLT